MKRTHAVFILLAVCASCLAPVRAYANVGWWDWLEQLSGPGPFARGFMLDVRLACQVATSKGTADTPEKVSWVGVAQKVAEKHPCLTNADSVRSYFAIRGGRITSARKELFQDVPGQLVGTVAAHSLQGYLMRELDPAFSIGAGAGWMWFSGDNLDQTPRRFVFTPISAAFMPLKLVAKNSRVGGVLVIRAEEVAIVGSMTAADFNTTSTSRFRARSELVRSVSVMFDIGALFNK